MLQLRCPKLRFAFEPSPGSVAGFQEKSWGTAELLKMPSILDVAEYFSSTLAFITEKLTSKLRLRQVVFLLKKRLSSRWPTTFA